MWHPLTPEIARDLPNELDDNGLRIAQLVTMLSYLLKFYTEYYARLLPEVAQFSSDIPGTEERLQSALSEMENLTPSLSNLLKTLTPRSYILRKILRSDDFQDFCKEQAGKFFL